MPFDEVIFSMSVKTTDKDRNYWASRQGLTQSTISGIRSADLLVVPWENRAGCAIAFPDGTNDFIALIRSNSSNFSFCIAVESDEYSEISQHSRKILIPSLLVSTLVLPTVANILAAEFEKIAKKEVDPPSVEISITVHNQFGKCISFEYKGPSDRSIDTLIHEVDRCFPMENHLKSKSKPAAKVNKSAKGSNRRYRCPPSANKK